MRRKNIKNIYNWQKKVGFWAESKKTALVNSHFPFKTGCDILTMLHKQIFDHPLGGTLANSVSLFTRAPYWVVNEFV